MATTVVSARSRTTTTGTGMAPVPGAPTRGHGRRGSVATLPGPATSVSVGVAPAARPSRTVERSDRRRAVRQAPAAMTVAAALAEWELALRSQNASRHTIKNYFTAIRQLRDYFLDQGFNLAPDEVTRSHVREFLGHLAETRSPATAQTRYDGLNAFFAWLVDEGEIDIGDSPMLRVKRPRAPEPETEILDLQEMAAMVLSCKPRTFEDVRDRAILRVFVDTGVRVGGLADALLADLDLKDQRLALRLKGGRRKAIHFGVRATTDLTRYVRWREMHPKADSTYLWLGWLGHFTDSGIRQMVEERGRQVLGKHVHPHMFRHSFVHYWKSNDGRDDELIELAGWSSGKQLERYGRQRRLERAVAAHRRLSPGDRI